MKRDKNGGCNVCGDLSPMLGGSRQVEYILTFNDGEKLPYCMNDAVDMVARADSIGVVSVDKVEKKEQK